MLSASSPRRCENIPSYDGVDTPGWCPIRIWNGERIGLASISLPAPHFETPSAPVEISVTSAAPAWVSVKVPPRTKDLAPVVVEAEDLT
jgi:hypothetical protein